MCPVSNGLNSVHLCLGVIRALYEYYQTECKDCVHVWLSADTDHYCSSAGDKGWGCGYRNFQMLLSSLHRIDTYATVLQGAQSHHIISDLESAPFCCLLPPHCLCFINFKQVWECSLYCSFLCLQLYIISIMTMVSTL